MIEEIRTSSDIDRRDTSKAVSHLLGKKLLSVEASDDSTLHGYTKLNFEDGYYLEFYDDEWGFSYNVKETIMDINAIIAAVNLYNSTAPAIASLILSMKKGDGTETVLAHLDLTEQQADANIQEAQAWLDAHK